MFKNLKFRTKLIAILLLPVIGMIYFAIGGIADKSNLSSEMGRLQELSNLAVKISVLVHETQKERGATAGYLSSKGKKFKSERMSQITQTEKRTSELRDFLQDFNSKKIGGNFSTQLDRSISELGRINDKRRDISNFSISTADAIAYYTNMNSGFLDIISNMVKLSSNSKVTILASGYVNFLLSKERAGIERAVGNSIFSTNKVTSASLQKFNSLVTAQETYTNVFLSFSNQEQSDFYNSKMSSGQIEEVQKMRNIIFEKGTDVELGVDASNWFRTISNKINLLKEIENKLSEDLISNSRELGQRAKQSLLFYSLITALLVILTSVLSYFVITGVLRQLGGEPKEVMEMSQKIVDGYLSININKKKKSDIGIYGMMIKMTERLRSIVGEVKNAADNVAAGSNELSGAAQSLSQGATEQAAAAEEISSSIEEMGSNIQQNTDNSQQTEKISAKASLNAKESGEAVNEASVAMKEISEKINIIQEIARQTNLLALNAAIEAARAGEHGKGFAVVASEVRKLAERSQNAAEEITELAKNSLSVAEKAGEMINILVPDIGKTADLVAEITASSIEQNQGAVQISKAINELDKVVQENAGSAEEMASTSEELSSQAQLLQSSISFFKLEGESTVSPFERQTHRPVSAAAKPKVQKLTKQIAPKTGGMKLDMGSGSGRDSEDSDFERF